MTTHSTVTILPASDNGRPRHQSRWISLLFSSLLIASSTTAAVKAPANVDEKISNALFTQDVVDYLQCQVCHTPELTGSVLDSGCDYETVDKAVSEHFHPLLHELSQLTFFRYFKVDLGKECPYWQDDGMCASIDCAVCECPSHEIPTKWYQMDREEARRKSKGIVSEKPGMPCSDQTGESELSRVDRTNAIAGKSFRAWEEGPSPNVWSNQGNTPDESMVYINLLENPERYTGYSGIQAERIWNAIYQENCFKPPTNQENDMVLKDLCFEERVFYRLISGLQSSINTHIALRYKYGEEWGPNPSLYVHRVGKHRDRLQNLYFAYLFVMRAVGRYRHELIRYDYSTGNDEDDQRVREILRKLVLEDPEDKDECSCPSERNSVLTGFDEQALFRVLRDPYMSHDQFLIAQEEKRELEVQFREKFQNISRIMDCVTCEKCRLWGTIQTMGLGTAIKILLADDVQSIPTLHRNELIALINVANNLSRSIDGIRLLRQLEFAETMRQFTIIGGIALLLVLAMIICLRRWNGSNYNYPQRDEKKKTK